VFELPRFCGDEVKQITVFEPALHVEQSGGPPRMGPRATRRRRSGSGLAT
jgi:hypothetical protein